MVDFILECTCAFCGAPYPVKLGRMWLNLHDPCPVCGFPNSLSESQAMEALDFLKRLEWEQAIMNPPQPTNTVLIQ